MNVRSATPADAEAIREMYRVFIEGLGLTAYTHKQVDAWTRGCESADYVALITSDDTYLIIIEDNDYRIRRTEMGQLDARSLSITQRGAVLRTSRLRAGQSIHSRIF